MFYPLSRNELDGIVAMLRDIFEWNLSAAKNADPSDESEKKLRKARQQQERDFRKSRFFLEPVFIVLHDNGHWVDILKHVPRKIEVTLLPMDDKDRRVMPNTSAKALTLYISLPKGCIRKANRTFLWGGIMPNRFYFDDDGKGNFVLLGANSPIADI